MEEFKQQIRTLIGEAKLDIAINLLASSIKNNEQLKAIILQQARYNKMKNNLTNGTASLDDSNREFSSLNSNILNLLDAEDLMIHDEQGINEYSIEDLKENLNIAHTRMKLAHLFIAQQDSDNALSIKDIIDQTKLKSRKLVVEFIKELDSFDLLEKRKVDKIATWKLNIEGRKILDKITKL